MTCSKIMIGIVCVLVLGTSNAAPAAKPEEAIKYRRGVMAAQGWNFRAMGDVIKGDLPYDKAEFAQRAANLAALSKLALEGFLVEGAEKGETKAKPEMFGDLDKVKEGMTRLSSETNKLAQVAAAGELGAIKAQFNEVSKICKGCHDNYRVR